MFKMDVLVTALIGVITTTTSGWVSWFFTRRKYNTDVDHSVIENMEKSLEFYSKLAEDNKERLEEVLKRNANLESDINKVKTQLAELVFLTCKNMSCQLRERKLLEEV